MSYADKHIVETYSGLFEGLSSDNKLELIETLSKSLKIEEKSKDESFYKAFGAWTSDKTAEEIIADIRSSRVFRKKDIEF